MLDVPVVFHFEVSFDVNASGEHQDQDNRFQEVTGLSAEVTVEEFKEGGLNQYVHKLPNGAKYGNLVLKRGYITNSAMTKWCREAIETFKFEPKDIAVHLLNEEHEPLASWQFSATWPVKWSVSDFKAQENALVVESLELAYSMFRYVGLNNNRKIL